MLVGKVDKGFVVGKIRTRLRLDCELLALGSGLEVAHSIMEYEFSLASR